MAYNELNTLFSPEYFFDASVSEDEKYAAFEGYVQKHLDEWAASNGVEDCFSYDLNYDELSFSDFIQILKSHHVLTTSRVQSSGLFDVTQTKAKHGLDSVEDDETQSSTLSLCHDDFPNYTLEIFRDLNNTDPYDPLIQAASEIRILENDVMDYVRKVAPGVMRPYLKSDLTPNVRFFFPNFSLQYPHDEKMAVEETRNYFYSQVESETQKLRFQAELEAMIAKACELQSISYIPPQTDQTYEYNFVISVDDLKSKKRFYAYDKNHNKGYYIQLSDEFREKFVSALTSSSEENVVLNVNRLMFSENLALAKIQQNRYLPDGTLFIPQTTYAQQSEKGEIYIEEVFDVDANLMDYQERSLAQTHQAAMTVFYALGASGSRGVESARLIQNTQGSIDVMSMQVGTARVQTTLGQPSNVSNTAAQEFIAQRLNGQTQIRFDQNVVPQSPTPKVRSSWVPVEQQTFKAQGLSNGSQVGKSTSTGVVLPTDVPPLPTAKEIFSAHENNMYQFWLQNYPALFRLKPQTEATSGFMLSESFRASPVDQTYILPSTTMGLTLQLPTVIHGENVIDPIRPEDLIHYEDQDSGEVEAWIWDGVDISNANGHDYQLGSALDTLNAFQKDFIKTTDEIDVLLDRYISGQITELELKDQLGQLYDDFIILLDRYDQFRYEYSQLEENDPYVIAMLHDYCQPMSVISGRVEMFNAKTTFTREDVVFLKEKISGKLENRDRLAYSSLLNGQGVALEESQRWHARPIEVNLDPSIKSTRFIDRERWVAFDRIVNNFLSNAARYQNPNVSNPHVDVVMYQPNPETVVFEITDNGLGFVDTNLSQIGLMGFRESRFDIAESTGTGLFSVVSLAKKHGWGLAIKSDENKGTTWRVTLLVEDFNKVENVMSNSEIVDEGFVVLTKPRQVSAP